MAFSDKNSGFSLRRIGNRLAQPDILFWVLPFMMLMLFFGTIAQKEFGILVAQTRYFSSLFYMVGPVPLPGGMTLTTLLFINILAKFLFKSQWSWEKSGTILTHLGVLLLLVGGMVTYFTSYEGYIRVQEGQSSAVIQDYHQRELVVRKDGERIFIRRFEDLIVGQDIKEGDVPFTLHLLKKCYNCAISARPEDDQEGWTRPGKFMQLNAEKPDPQDEKNLTGVEFKISDVGKDIDGKYLTFDNFPKPPEIKIGENIYRIAIEHAERALPFIVTLDEFKRATHQGTDMAKAFQSRIRVKDKAGEWPALIEMNEPLRYKGYTLYQSSFEMGMGKPTTILTVVDNKGRLFPYIATCVLAFGLIVHIIMRLWIARAKCD